MLGEPVLCSFPSLRAIKNSFLAAAVSLALSGILLPAQQAGYSVRGTVLDSTTRQPIARALVQLANGDAVLTDSNGGFEFSNLPAQQTIIQVRRPGYLTNQTDAPGIQPSQDQVSTFSVTIGSNTPSLNLSLMPEAVLTGQLSLLDSDAADGIQVTAYRKGVENGRPKWTMTGFATTNSQGIFRIASLSAGSYLLYTQPSLDLTSAIVANSASSGYPPVYFPGVTDASSAGVIALATGEHKQADITLLRQTFYPVTIKVANAPPGDFVNLDIQDSGGRAMQLGGTRYDAQQQAAHASLPAGRYVLDARVFDIPNNRSPMFGHVEFTVSTAPVTYVSISVLPLRNIPVIIRREFAAPSNAGGDLEFYRESGRLISHTAPPSPGLNLNLVVADATFSGGNYAGGLQPVPGSNDESAFQIESVPPGKYWIQANAFEGYISSISSGGVDLAHDVLTVGAGGSSAPIEVTLRNDAGSIDGTIGAGPALSGDTSHAWIYAIPLFGTTSELPSAVPDSSGKFTFDRLPPGSYRVVACDSPRQIEFRTPEGLAAWAGRGQVVNVEAGGAAHVQLDVTTTAELGQ